MSNRRRSRLFKKNRKAFIEEAFNPGLRVDMPKSEKTVLKVVPAKADGEDIGQTVFYEDGTFDMIVNEDISDTAKAHIADFKLFMAGED